MRSNLTILYIVVLFIIGCSSNKHVSINSNNSPTKLLHKVECKDKLLCEYTGWFKKSLVEIKKLQKEYNISYKVKPILVKDDIINIQDLINNEKFMDKIRTSIGCKNGELKSITYNKTKVIFSCSMSELKEFRYSIYYAYIKNETLIIEPIDSGGGIVE